MDRKAILRGGEVQYLTFDETYALFENFVHWTCQKYVLPSSEDYEDALQIARIFLWRTYKTYDITKGFEFSSYAGKAMIWHVFRYRYPRKHKVDIACSLDAEFMDDSPLCYGDRLLGQCDPDVEDRLLVRQVLNSLDKRSQRLLLLYASGYKHKEMGPMVGLNVTQPHISRLIRQAREQFKELYKKEAAYALT